MSDPTVPEPRPPSPSPSPSPGPAPVPPPQYAPPPGHTGPPLTFAPPPGYGPYAPPYVAPVALAPVAIAPPARGSALLGVVALVAAIVAAVGAPLVGGLAAYRIGIGAGQQIASRPIDADFDWSVLAPVRDWVLLGEVAFWAGTAVGVWALVQGIIAILKNRGRVPAIVGVAVALLGPVLFGIAVQIGLTAGFAAGSSIGG